MVKMESDKDASLRKQIQETLDYMAFSLRKEATVTGTMGFKLISEDGTDMSFVMHIEESENGNIAYGEFGEPESADLLVTVPAEDFIRIYQGNVGVSTITRLIFRGRISVRNYDISGVSQFMGAFEFSSQKWTEYYAYCDAKIKEEELICRRLVSVCKPMFIGNMLTIHFPWLSSSIHPELLCEIRNFSKYHINPTSMISLPIHSHVITPYSDISIIPKLSPVESDSPSPPPSNPSKESVESTPPSDPSDGNEGSSVCVPPSLSRNHKRWNPFRFVSQVMDQAIVSDDVWPTNLWDETHMNFNHYPVIGSLYRKLMSQDVIEESIQNTGSMFNDQSPLNIWDGIESEHPLDLDNLGFKRWRYRHK